METPRQSRANVSLGVSGSVVLGKTTITPLTHMTPFVVLQISKNSSGSRHQCWVTSQPTTYCHSRNRIGVDAIVCNCDGNPMGQLIGPVQVECCLICPDSFSVQGKTRQTTECILMGGWRIVTTARIVCDVLEGPSCDELHVHRPQTTCCLFFLLLRRNTSVDEFFRRCCRRFPRKRSRSSLRVQPFPRDRLAKHSTCGTGVGSQLVLCRTRCTQPFEEEIPMADAGIGNRIMETVDKRGTRYLG